MADPDRRAFLDANVLRGSLQTDVLLTLAFRDEFQPRWNAEVMDEVRRNRPPGMSESAIDRRLGQMNRAFPQAMVEGAEHLEPAMQADPKDKHVLASAVHSNSTVLVTENVKDFNPPTTGPHAMPVQRLSKFLSDLTRENPARMVDAMREMVGRNQRDPNTLPALIDRMAQLQDLKGFAQTLNSVVPENERGTDPALAQGRQAGGPAAEVAGQGRQGAGSSAEVTAQGPQASGPSAEVAAQGRQASGSSAEVDPQAKAASALAFDGVAGAGTKAPDRQAGSQEKAQTTQTPKPPERER